MEEKEMTRTRLLGEHRLLGRRLQAPQGQSRAQNENFIPTDKIHSEFTTKTEKSPDKFPEQPMLTFFHDRRK
jgi:hypothetical protein